jgi:zinc protease
LRNGLRVVVVHDPRASQVQVTMRYRVGAVDDPAGREGMAHFVEHLMFQQVQGSQTLFARLENNATYFNGETSLDTTTYVARASVDKLDELISVEGVRMALHCISVTDAAFARERSVVLDELRLRDDASRFREAVHGAVFPDGHPYRRNEGGSEQSVGAITRDEACAFVDAHYTPGNAVLVVSGPVTVDRVEAATAKMLARVVKRTVPVQPPAPAVAREARQLVAEAPVDDDMLLVTWPMPADPRLRAQLAAVTPIAAALVDNAIAGRVVTGMIGGARTPMFAMFVVPSTSETFADVKAKTQDALAHTAVVFASSGSAIYDRFFFESTKQTAITQLFDTLEDGSGRDERLAGYALAGRDSSVELASEMRGLRDMSRDDAARVAREYLSFEHATVVTLKHAAGKKRGHEVTFTPPTHDVGRHRDPADPIEAHKPVAGDLDTRGFTGMRTRTLPNGLRVVLLPVTSVPTVDVRMVFDAGSADEPAGARGSALVAAHALGWGRHDARDLLNFLQAGGSLSVDAERDHTTFSAQGLDMHVDLLLTGVARLVRDGEYGRSARATVKALHHQDKKIDDEGVITDTWRAALYGPGHPYVVAGLARHASSTLSVDDAVQFRSTYFTPDNATLVIAGRFDPELADRWVDYLFADWRGTAGPRSTPVVHPQPASIARVEDTSQLALEIAIPATAGHTAERLVAAEMLDEIAGDVRQELGASYEMSAYLSESRLAASYFVRGYVEVGRAKDAVELVQKRIAQLRDDPEAAASAFVSARQRALVHVLSVTGSAFRLAKHVEHDVSLGREPMANAATANAIKSLQIESMTAILAELDLARAAMLVRGPDAEVRAAYAALGREPSFIDAVKVDTVATVAADTDSDTDRSALDQSGSHAGGEHGAPRAAGGVADVADVEDDATATTSSDSASAKGEKPGSQVSILVAPGLTYGSIVGLDVSGFTVAGEIGFSNTKYSSIGIHMTFGSLSGSYMDFARKFDFSIVPVSLELYGRGVLYDRYWLGAGIGVHTDLETEGAGTASGMGISVMAEAGADILKLGRHHVGAFLRIEDEVVGDAAYSATTLGVAYRQ